MERRSGVGLAYQIDVAVNIYLGWGYIVYGIALLALQTLFNRRDKGNVWNGLHLRGTVKN